LLLQLRPNLSKPFIDLPSQIHQSLNIHSLKVCHGDLLLLLETCRASGADTNQVVQAIVDALMITLIIVGPDSDTAARNIRNIANDMLNQVHKSYDEYHAMVAAQRNTLPTHAARHPDLLGPRAGPRRPRPRG
jgi:hypothetical protein